MNRRPFGAITPGQIVWWTTASFLGLGRFMFPRELVTTGGMGAGYAFVLMCAAAYAAGLLIVSLMRRFPGWTAVDVAVASMGAVGRGFEALMSGVMLLVLVEAFRLFSFMLSESMLMHTPGWAIIGLAALCTAFGAGTGVEAVSRALQLLSPILLVIAVTGCVSGLFELHPVFLTPHWTGWRRELSAAYHGLFIFAGLQAVFMFSGLARSPGRLRRGVLIGISLDVAVLLLIFVDTLGNLGVNTMPVVEWPAPMLARAITFSGFYITRIGYLAMIAVVGQVLLFLTQTSAVVGVALVQTLALPSEAYPAAACAVVGATALGALFIPNSTVAEAIALSVISPLTLFMLFGKLAILWAASKIRLRQRPASGPAAAPPAGSRRGNPPAPRAESALHD